MTATSRSSRTSLYAVTGLTIAIGLTIGGVAESIHTRSLNTAPRVVAQCNDADTEDSFSMSCTPNVIPDTSDQLTEAEVAEPGFNAMPGGFGGEGGGMSSGHEGFGGGGHAGFGGGGHGGGGGGGGGGHGR